ncbi:probable manganese-transporting ATPase PDR2 isoform X2 [Glycine max]|uniref:probable manganese-transporting ATPase PDR2 isoform X2 n=1 Tax=Glycine max TaxID=3847 RepID=UPI001B355715|nr:probable manganese-transporting ATPase PDR2 isoform X2 [Glycine max]XP_040869561.1 probable manganese-transporting ATPase PDR2 isoform X2 [Glycine max]
MLFMFESTMAKSRLKTLTELRRVRVDSQILMVHRYGKWVKLSGTELLPEDVVSIGRSSGQNGEEKSVPADMLLLAGSVIVNEAILTGESTPQWKISIAGRGMEETLSARQDKNHVLFGGTKILQHTPDKSFPLKTPDGGCLVVILRTGFETSQGKLMRTILFSTERVTANSWESGFFILFLVVFALIAAGYVLVKEFSGIVGLNGTTDLESDTSKVPLRTVEILASCHALVFVENKLGCLRLHLLACLPQTKG